MGVAEPLSLLGQGWSPDQGGGSTSRGNVSDTPPCQKLHAGPRIPVLWPAFPMESAHVEECLGGTGDRGWGALLGSLEVS